MDAASPSFFGNQENAELAAELGRDHFEVLLVGRLCLLPLNLLEESREFGEPQDTAEVVGGHQCPPTPGGATRLAKALRSHSLWIEHRRATAVTPSLELTQLNVDTVMCLGEPSDIALSCCPTWVKVQGLCLQLR